jgi:hypothetical protein
MEDLKIGDHVNCRSGTGFERPGTIIEFRDNGKVVVDIDEGAAIQTYLYDRIQMVKLSNGTTR